METLANILWLFGKRLWFEWRDPTTGKIRCQTNCATWKYLWWYRKYPVKVWVD